MSARGAVITGWGTALPSTIVTNADGMRAHKIDLKLANLFANDADVTQFADASGDRVGNFVVRDERIHHRASAVDGLARIWSEQHRLTSAELGDFAHGFQGQIVSVNV